MLLKNGATDQKLRGGYYTPKPLADSIVKLFIDDVNEGNIKSVLEPSAGDGIFIKSIQNYLNLDKIDNITAVELLEEEAENINDSFEDQLSFKEINHTIRSISSWVWGTFDSDTFSEIQSNRAKKAKGKTKTNTKAKKLIEFIGVKK